jgi:predicted enzyme related to lactoylglutathione lyase
MLRRGALRNRDVAKYLDLLPTSNRSADRMTVELEAGIVGRDPGTLVDFYTRVLGFALSERLDAPAGVVYKLRRDAARLKLFFSVDEVDPIVAAVPWSRFGGWRYAALYLERDTDVDALASSVGASNGRVLIEPTNHRPGARMALVCDPEENVWELLAEIGTEEHPHP